MKTNSRPAVVFLISVSVVSCFLFTQPVLSDTATDLVTNTQSPEPAVVPGTPKSTPPADDSNQVVLQAQPVKHTPQMAQPVMNYPTQPPAAPYPPPRKTTKGPFGLLWDMLKSLVGH